ncbi:MAG: DUF2167 domain-containing protein [Verrucomicrobiales bacterium]|nr:DUF2167 domain-containing protein [Verrucomicrobiales bacterium]
MKKPSWIVWTAAVCCMTVSSVDAQSLDTPSSAEVASAEEQARQFYEMVETFGWERSGVGQLGSEAEIDIPKGYRFSGSSGCQKLMQLYGNPTNESELGVIAPESLAWCVVFEFEDIGYVKDSDKDDLDASAILKQLQEGQEQSNEYRKEHGMEPIYITGWAKEPAYNPQTHNLEWAIRLRDDRGEQTVNYLTRLLGRNGVMSVTLVVDPEALDASLPEYQALLTGYRYQTGNAYAEYRQGDRVAKYTLAGLITAGAGFAAVKSGLFGKLGLLFAKMGKLAIVFVVAIGAAIKKFFGGMFGGKGKRLEDYSSR